MASHEHPLFTRTSEQRTTCALLARVLDSAVIALGKMKRIIEDASLRLPLPQDEILQTLDNLRIIEQHLTAFVECELQNIGYCETSGMEVLSQEVVALKAQVQALTAGHLQDQTLIATLRSEIASLQGQIATVQSAPHAPGGYNGHLTQELSLLQQRCVQLEAENAVLTDALLEGQQKSADLEAKNAARTAELMNSEQNVNSLHQKLLALNTLLVETDSGARISELEQRCEYLDAENAALTEALQANATQQGMTALEQRCEYLDAENAALKEALQETQHEPLLTEISTLQEMIAELRVCNEAYQKENEELLSKGEELEAIINLNESETEQLKAKLHEAQESPAAGGHAVGGHQQHLAGELSASRQRCATLEDKNAQLSADLQNMQQDVLALREQCGNFESYNMQLSADLQSTQEEVLALRESCGRLKAENAALTNATQQDVIDAQLEIVTEKGKSAGLEDVISQLRAELLGVQEDKLSLINMYGELEVKSAAEKEKSAALEDVISQLKADLSVAQENQTAASAALAQNKVFIDNATQMTVMAEENAEQHRLENERLARELDECKQIFEEKVDQLEQKMQETTDDLTAIIDKQTTENSELKKNIEDHALALTAWEHTGVVGLEHELELAQNEIATLRHTNEMLRCNLSIPTRQFVVQESVQDPRSFYDETPLQGLNMAALHPPGPCVLTPATHTARQPEDGVDNLSGAESSEDEDDDYIDDH